MEGSYLLQSIDENHYSEFFTALQDSKGPFHLCISSCGGDTGDMWAFVDTILTTKRRIIGTAMGVCHSAAPLILAACDVRRCAPNTQFMVHEDSIRIRTTPSKARKFVERQQAEEDRWYLAMATLTNATIGQWRKLSEDETYFDATEALNLGLVDKIISIRRGSK
jgi:ATP-dependent protease ClpP protease subunit